MNEEMQRSLGRVEGKLDLLLETMTNHLKEDDARFAMLDTRFSKVEKRVYMATGTVASLISVVAFFFRH